MHASIGPTRSAPPRGWLVLAAVAVVYAAAATVIVAVRAESSSDFRDYWRTALHFRETGQISAELGVHNYLPFFAIFMLPWSFLPLRVAIVAFTLLSLGLLALTVVMVETLLMGRLERRPRAALLIALGLMAPYSYSCTVLGAVGLFVGFLIVLTWFLFERGREWEAGVALGLAILIKVLPGALLIFFLLKWRWRVAAAAVAVCLLLGFGSPLASLGFRQAVIQHEGFLERAASEHSAWATITGDQPRKVDFHNAALPAVLRRVLTPTSARPGTPSAPLTVNLVDLARPRVFGIYVVLIAAVALVSAAFTLQPPADPGDPVHVAWNLRSQFGVWCCVMLLAAPLLWIHYLPMVYWPLALVADRVERTAALRGRPCRWAAAALIVWLVGAVLLAWPAARAAGAQLAALAFLWLVLVIRGRTTA